MINLTTIDLSTIMVATIIGLTTTGFNYLRLNLPLVATSIGYATI